MADGFDVGAARAELSALADYEKPTDSERWQPTTFQRWQAAQRIAQQALDALGLATQQRVLTKDEQRLMDVICDSGVLGVGSTRRLRALITRLTGPPVKE